MKCCKTVVEPFIREIRNLASPNPEALPQRSNDEIRDEFYETRILNKNLYASARERFVEEALSLPSDSRYPGLYFFYSRLNQEHPFFYIGKANNLYDRLTKHFLTLDYIFYSIAYPKNRERYYSDCIRFYADGLYAKNKHLYDRQFGNFKLSPFNEIAWISVPAFVSPVLLSEVENNAIDYFKPLANGTKGSKKSDIYTRATFENVKSVVEREFL